MIIFNTTQIWPHLFIIEFLLYNGYIPMTIGVQQDIVSTSSKDLFSILSRDDNLKMFEIAKNGLKISISILDKLEISPKRYYKALKQLKDARLIEKNNRERAYFHTTFGSIVYQRNIVEMAQYTQHLEKMQMIDTIREAKKFPETAIASFIEELKSTVVGFSSPSLYANLSRIASPSSAPRKPLCPSSWIEARISSKEFIFTFCRGIPPASSLPS
jgi:DNA-binding PadR family transcriptional regulator